MTENHTNREKSGHQNVTRDVPVKMPNMVIIDVSIRKSDIHDKVSNICTKYFNRFILHVLRDKML